MSSDVDKNYSCPICGKPGERSARYPRYICVECGYRATDEDGRPLRFTNVLFSGGFAAIYSDTHEERESHICYINGIKCWADEAYFGGIVIQPCGEES